MTARQDEPTRVQPPRRRPSNERAQGIAARIGRAWRQLTPDQRLAAVAALALLLSMLLPWYQETGNAIVDGKLAPIEDSKSAFQVYSFVEAAVFVVAIGVLALLWARAEGRSFHLPFGDGGVIIAGGLWVMFLVFYRQLDKPDGHKEGVINTSVGVQWGIFIAFILGGVLAYAGYRIRAANTPEPAENAPSPAPPRPAPPPPVPADAEPTAVARRPPPRPTGEDGPYEGQLSFDEPAEYQPPPRS